MPQLIVMRLPNDHTSGTKPGMLTPTGKLWLPITILALGRGCRGPFSRSRFWKSDGNLLGRGPTPRRVLTHVDAYRTYRSSDQSLTSRGVRSILIGVQHIQWMLRTMELCPRPRPNEPIRSCRPTDVPRIPSPTKPGPGRSFLHRLGQVVRFPMWPRTPELPGGPKKSMKLDLDEAEDRADDLVFNEILWKSVKGADPSCRRQFADVRDAPAREREGAG